MGIRTARTAECRALSETAGLFGRLLRRGDLLSLGLLGVLSVLFLIEPLLGIPLRVPRNYNEGWNAFHALQAVTGAALYPPPDALIANNYPPLSFYIVGGIGLLIGDPIVAGRIIAFLSLLLVAGNIALVLRRMSSAAVPAAFAALLFLAYVTTHYAGYVGVSDPQWLGHALMTTGLVLFLGGQPPGRTTIPTVLAPVLMLAGGLVKHNLIPLPAAILLWLLIHDRRRFRLWLAICLPLTGAVIAAAYLAYGPVFFTDIFAYPRVYSVWRLVEKFEDWGTPLVPFVTAAGGLLLLSGGDRAARLILLYVLLAGAFGVAILGGTGIAYNALFDLLIALCLAAGLFVDRAARWLAASGAAAVWGPATMLLLTLPVLASVPGNLLHLAAFLERHEAHRAETADQIAFLAAQPGPVACHQIALCYWAGKDFTLDFAYVAQKVATGMLSEAALIERLERRAFDAIEVTGAHKVISSFHVLTGVSEWIGMAYEPAGVDAANGVIMVPKERRAAGGAP